MRIADKMNYEQVRSSLSKNRTELAELQNQAATQKKVNKPSDDPMAASRVLAARTEINGNTQFLKSINQAKAFLEYSDQSLGELTEALTRAKELAIGQANDASANDKSREVTAAEVEQILSQAIQVGNRKLGDRFLFGGFRTTRPPFDQSGNYAGDNGEMQIAINKEASIGMNIPGSLVFLGQIAPEPVVGREDGPSPIPQKPESQSAPPPQMRGPASLANGSPSSGDEEAGRVDADDNSGLSYSWASQGVNIFRVLRNLEIGLRSNDKSSVQESLDELDSALAQVVLARSKLGARVMTLNSTAESLQKGQVDAKTMASNFEDADTFEVVSDLNKTESTLKATLATSGKLIQPSLLDFLR